MKKLNKLFLKIPDLRRFIKEDQPYILTLSLVLVTVYSLYIFIPFGTYDDYERAWSYILSPQTAGLYQLKTNMMDGRFFNGLFLWLFFKPSSISYFGVYRLINLFLVIVLSIILFKFLNQGINKISALLVSIIICVLPSFSIMFYFASLMGVITGGILSGISVWLLTNGKSRKDTKGIAISRLFLSCFLLIIAVQFYQPIAMFYWIFVTILLLFDFNTTVKPFLTKYLLYFSIFIIALLVTFLLIRLSPSITGLSFKSRTAIIGIYDLIDKIKWFINVPLHQSLNFFLLLSIPRFIVISGFVFIFGGLYFWFRGSVASRLVKVVFLLTMIPLAYLPNLVVTENWASFRSMIALSSVWVILIYFSAKGFSRLYNDKKGYFSNLGKYSLIIWGSAAIIFSIYHSTTYIVLPAFMEHRFIHYKIGEFQLKVGDKVYVSLADYTDSSSPFFYGDEFGIPTTAYSWGAHGITNLVIQEYGFSAGQIQVIKTDDPEKAPINQFGMHHLDLRIMENFQLLHSMYPIERLKIIINSFFQMLAENHIT